MESGYLKPIISQMQVSFGASSVKHDNWLMTLIMRQVIDLAMVIVENSSYFLGKYVYADQMEPILTYAMNDYKLPFTLPNLLPGQSVASDFELDFRNTYKPFIGNGFMEMWFIGDLLFDGKSCGVNFQEVPMAFIEDDKFTQLVMTESALSCIANSIAASNHGTINWNQ